MDSAALVRKGRVDSMKCVLKEWLLAESFVTLSRRKTYCKSLHLSPA